MTAEELLKLPTGMGERYELVRGELKIISPAGFEQGDIAMELVWIIYPQTQEVVVFKSARESVVLSLEDTLDGGDVIPGFTCPVAELFE